MIIEFPLGVGQVCAWVWLKKGAINNKEKRIFFMIVVCVIHKYYEQTKKGNYLKKICYFIIFISDWVSITTLAPQLNMGLISQP